MFVSGIQRRPWVWGAVLCVCAVAGAPDVFATVQHVKKRAAHSKSSALSGVLHYQTKMLKPTVHHELAIAQIESMSGFNRNGTWQNPGLTVGAHELKTDFQIAGTQRTDQKSVRVWLDSLDVVFQYSALDVYVANDYAEGSCESAQILLHEMEHVKVHQRLYAKYSAELRKVLTTMKLPTRRAPVSYASLSVAQRDLSARLKASTQGVYARFKKDLSDENNRLDTVANYRSIQKRCNGWK